MTTARWNNYQQKPCDAFRFTGRCFTGKERDWPTGWLDVKYDFSRNGNRLFIHTNCKVLAAETGDWIIKDLVGDFFVCKPDVFEETYDSLAS